MEAKAIKANPYKDFTCNYGTLQLRGHDATVAALIIRNTEQNLMSTYGYEIIRAACSMIGAIPPFDAIVLGPEWMDEEPDKNEQRKGKGHLMSKKAAAKLETNNRPFVEEVKTAYKAAHDDRSKMANTLAGNRDQSFIS